MACDSMDYIEYNVSQIARESGLTGTNLGRQLHTHYPEVLEFREWALVTVAMPGFESAPQTYCFAQVIECSWLW